jgi:hypothetical protein
VGYAVSLPLSATWDLRYADRMRRAMARIRTYLRLRRETGLQQSLMTELVWLREEAIALDTAIDDASRGDRSGVPTAGVRV